MIAAANVILQNDTIRGSATNIDDMARLQLISLLVVRIAPNQIKRGFVF